MARNSDGGPVLAALVAGGIVAALAVLLHGPAWLCAVLAIAAALTAFRAGSYWRGTRRPVWPTTFEPTLRAAEHETSERESPVAGRLPSRDVGFDFQVACGALWRPNPDAGRILHHNLAQLAADYILDRCRALTASERLIDHSAVQVRLAAVLGEETLDPSGQVWARATNISLTVDQRDIARLDTVVQVNKDLYVRERQRESERAERAYLTRDVFATTGSAAGWWLARHPDGIEEAARLLDSLKRLSDAIKPVEVAQVPREPTDDSVSPLARRIQDLIRAVLPDGGEDTYGLFAKNLATLLDGYGCDEAAAETRTLFREDAAGA